MPPFVIPYSGYYPEPKRNEPVRSRAVNPLPDNKMSNDTGDAGQDGYTVFSRANRYNGLRPCIEGAPAPDVPNLKGDQ